MKRILVFLLSLLLLVTVIAATVSAKPIHVGGGRGFTGSSSPIHVGGGLTASSTPIHVGGG
jgi:hypothetical protein